MMPLEFSTIVTHVTDNVNQIIATLHSTHNLTSLPEKSIYYKTNNQSEIKLKRFIRLYEKE